MSFEENLKKLEKNIQELERPELTLSRGIAVFEEGIVNARACMASLNESKGKIAVLKEEMNKLTETPFLGNDYE